ncbi:hypothetical protein LWM68_27230 [Niabella sp. W65]|nr:hypothetical protein [Niabella sp. W65]MCH7366137.1 hypothetical protein [Niabella sp. W65]ULT41868.1 hypothetical protein KRR40_46160 [Niabella sp. I65]
MPWYKGTYPPSYKSQPVPIRKKAVGIIHALLEEGMAEGAAIATGLKRAREFFAGKKPALAKKRSKR